MLSDTGTELLTMFQISNMTAIASNVNNLVTARAAYDNIFQNTMGGVLPFQVDV